MTAASRNGALAELVQRVFVYDPAGGDVRWRYRSSDMFDDGLRSSAVKAAQWNGKLAGKAVRAPAGSRIQFCGQTLQLTHIIWLLMTGGLPGGVIDHQNGDPRDNRFENLRDVPLADNNRNRKVPATNSSGAIGVHWCRRAQRWLARITVDGRKVEVGRSKVRDEAIRMWSASPFRARYHPNHGRMTSTNCELRGQPAPKTDATAGASPLPPAAAPVPANDSIPVHSEGYANVAQ